MRNFFNIDSPIMQKLSLFGTLIMMNVVWLICCIPIVTVGASTAAMYRVMFDLREDKNCRWVDFFRYFRDNFKQSTLLWLIYLLVAVVLYLLFCLISWIGIGNLARALLLIPFFLLFFLWFFSLHYCFALSAFFENTLKNTLINAAAMSLRHLRQTVVCSALTLLPFVFGMVSLYWLLALGYIWLFVYPGFSFYWKSGLIRKVFANYAPSFEQDTQDSEEE